MADIINTSSGYQTGSIDTATTLVNNVSPTDAKHINGPATAIVQIETILGSGTTLKGATADLATRLAVGLDTSGLLKLSTDASITGPLSVSKGGTGVATLADGGVLVGNGTGTVQALAVPTAGRVLVHSGTAAADPAWELGLLYHGPSSIGSGSTRSHEGTVTVSSNGNYSGIHYYTNFTLNSSVTMTIPAGSGRLIIVASGTVTINGTITGVGGGLYAGGTTDAQDGASGTDQVGGTGGGNASTVGGLGGVVKYNGWLSLGTASAGTMYPSAPPSTPATISGSSHPSLQDPFSMFGGSSGGASESGADGGYGGASLVIIAPTVVLGASGVINLSGQAGQNAAAGGADKGGGAGGGSGNLYVRTRAYTESGTITLAGGAGGSAWTSGIGTGAISGGAGASGWKQILIYA